MEPEGLDWTYRAVLHISRLFGVFPFEIVDSCKLRPTRVALVQTVLLMIISCYATYLSVFAYTTSALLSYFFAGEVFTVNFTLLCSNVSLLCKYQRLSEVLTVALAIQRRYRVPLRCTRCFLQLALFSVVLICITTWRFVVGTPANVYVWVLMGTYFTHSLMVTAMALQFASTVFLVGDCFAVITAAMLHSSHSRAELLILLQDHFSLMRAVKVINSCHGLQNLFFFTTGFCFITSSILYAIAYPEKSLFAILYGMLLFIALILTIVYVSNETKNKADTFTHMLYRVSLRGKSSSLQNNIAVCLHLTYTKEIQFTASDYFVLDLPLLCSMTGAATSYLLILIHFLPKS